MKIYLLMFWSVMAIPALASSIKAFPDLIADKEMWRSFDWEKPKSSKVWSFEGWEKVHDDSDDQLLFAKRQVELNGVALGASLIRVDDPEIIVKPYERMELHDSTPSFERCKKVEEWLTKNFGNPRMIVDTSYLWELPAPKKNEQRYNYKEEWYLGQTRAFLECRGVKGDQEVGSWETKSFKLDFMDKSYAVPLRSLTGLKCKYSGELKGKKTEGEDFFYVDDIYQRIYNDKLVPFWGGINSDLYRVSLPDVSGKEGFSIDINRRTMAYKAVVGLVQSQETRTGTCTKVDSGGTAERLKQKKPAW